MGRPRHRGSVTSPTDPPRGYRTRRPVPADAPAIFDLVAACDVAVEGESDSSLTEVESLLVAPGVDNERGGLLVLDDAGRVVGWLWTEDDPTASAVFLDPYSLDPAVLALLLREGLGYVAALATERGRSLTVKAGSFASDRPYAAVLTAAGFGVVRRFYRMVLPVDPDRPPPLPKPPPGVQVRVVDATAERDLRRLHAVSMSSFAELWGHTDRTFAEWVERLDASSGRDPSQWWLAEAEGEPAGLLLGDETHAGQGESYVRTLGVLPEHRGRGIGATLLRTAFAEAARRGRTAVALGVDSANPTGATRLYESVGMSVQRESLAWELR